MEFSPHTVNLRSSPLVNAPSIFAPTVSRSAPEHGVRGFLWDAERKIFYSAPGQLPVATPGRPVEHRGGQNVNIRREARSTSNSPW